MRKPAGRRESKQRKPAEIKAESPGDEEGNRKFIETSCFPFVSNAILFQADSILTHSERRKRKSTLIGVHGAGARSSPKRQIGGNTSQQQTL